MVWVPHRVSAGCSKPLGLGIIHLTCYRSTDNLLIRYAQDLIETLLIWNIFQGFHAVGAGHGWALHRTSVSCFQPLGL